MVDHDGRRVEPCVGAHRRGVVAREYGRLKGVRQGGGPLDDSLRVVVAMDAYHWPDTSRVDTRQSSGGSSGTVGGWQTADGTSRPRGGRPS